jgi:hypothetical protein
MLDAPARSAALALAAHLKVSPSEAMRRALLRYRDEICGPSALERQRRRRALEKLIETSEGMNPAEEIRMRKREDLEW